MLEQRRTTNFLLLVIVIPLVFYLLKILSFIFIPLIFSMFIALLFLPLMRWLGKRKVPKMVSIILVILLIIGGLKIGAELIKLSSQQIMASDTAFFEKAENVELLKRMEDNGVNMNQTDEDRPLEMDENAI